MTREELERMVTLNGDKIFVRAQVNGKWASVPIFNCTQETKDYYIDLWLSRGISPVMLKDARENLP